MQIRKNLSIALAALVFAGTVSAQHIPTEFGRSYESGIELFRAGHYLSAQKELENAREAMNPETEKYAEDLDYYLAVCYAENREDGAEEPLEAFLRKYPATIHANDIRLALGNVYSRNREYAQALEQYDRVRPYELSPSARSEYFFNKGYASFADGRHEEALNNFAMVGSDRVYGPSSVYYTAYIDYQNDRLDLARSGFSRLAGDRNYGPIVPFYLLHIDFKNRDYEAVVRSAPELLRVATGERRTEILRITGESYYHLNDYAEALRYMEAYAEYKPDLNREEQYMIGYAAYMTGDFERAIQYLNRVAVGNDLLAQNAGYHIGSASLRLGDKIRAKQAFSLAMKLDADKAVKEEAMFNYAKLEYELGGGMFNQSINTINQYLEEFPESPHIDEMRGYLLAAYMNSRNYAAAYDAIVRINNPDNEVRTALQKITYFRGLEFFLDGDYEKAQEMFATSVANRTNPKYTALTKFWQAETFYRQGEFTRAVPLYQDYIVLAPKDERENLVANYNLAYCYFNLRNLSESELWFGRFLSQYHASDAIAADAHNRLGDIAFINRNYSKAISEYDKSVAIGSAEGDYGSFQRAIALGLTSGNAQKINALKAIIDRGSGEYVDDAMYELGTTYRKIEQFSEAAATLNDFIGRYPDSPYYPDALADLGLIYQNMGNNAEAMRYYKMVVERNPNSPQAINALLGIRNLYVDNNDLEGYFAYADRSGVQTNISVIEKDSLTYSVAERIFLSGDARRALPLMQSYLEQYPNGGYVANATYYVADGHLQEGDKESALRGYEKVIAMKYNPFTVNALLKAGQLNLEDGRTEASAGQFRRVTELSSNRNTVVQALGGYLRSVESDPDPDVLLEAAGFAGSSAFANDEIRRDAAYLRGKAYMGMGEGEKAMEAFRIGSENVSTRNGAESKYLLAELLAEAGELDRAEVEIFDFSDKNTAHQFWLGKAFLLLGDIYLRKGDDFQAKATYQSIVDGYADDRDGIAEEASNRLNELN